MRRFLNRVLAAMSPMALWCAAASTACATTDPILDLYGTSLPLHPPGGNLSSTAPRLDQRGVDLDGTLRAPVPMGWSVAGDPLGGGYAAGRTLGDINLFTGSYHPTEVDLSFPTLGLPVVMGRTYSHVQQDGSGTQSSMPTVQGWNWGQTAQPEISLAQGASNDLDILYLYYGTDRFIEFKRIALNATEFKAKNGAAGVVKFTAAAGAAPETYTYYDQRGNQIVFLGFDGNALYGIGQIWKMIDPAGNTAYVYDASSGANVGSTGYDAFGGVTVWYDASGHRYTFTYATYGIYRRIQKVECEINTGSWTSIGKVEYDYYTSTTNDVGLMGDLKTVTITQGGVTSGPYVRTKYYRYYTRAWSNSNGRRGEAHMLKMVVGFDGVRQDASYASDSDATLLPYSEMYFEYPSGDRRIASVTINGNCGCSGGTSGTYSFTYGDSSGYATAVANTSYDTGWGKRTIITQPDGTYVTQHFDETGAVLGRVMSAASPANWTAGSGSNKTWITDVERNGSGQVTAIHSPANITGYTHSTGAITYSSSVGLVTTYARHSASSNIDGLRDSVSVKEGTSGTPSMTSSISMSDRQLVVGSAGVSMPEVTGTDTYPSGSAITTGYSYTYHSGTNTNVLYLAPKAITTTNPTVSSGNNGSNSSTATYRYLRTDGSTAYTKDAGGILFYAGRDAYGQTIRQIADVDTTSGDIFTSGTPDTDTASGWSISTSGTAIHAKTTMTYDDQGRILTRIQPSAETPGSSTRQTTWKYVLDGAKLGALVSPRYASSNYYGPLSYSRVNHAGKPDRRATIEIGSPSGTIPTSTTPTTSSLVAWSGMVDTVYDLSGMRAEETITYITTSTGDSALVGYDAMGRIARSVDATGTITRTIFDERGKIIERWMGTNDNGWTNPTGSVSGSNNMVKIEALEYDSNLAMGGGNGYLTKRSQDSSGAWSGGVGDRVTTYASDYRGRTIVTLPLTAPYSVTAFDNSNRAVATAQYNSTSGLTISTNPTTSTASTRVALSETAYDERGQVYQSTRWEIVQSGGSAGNKSASQITDNWYDVDGRPIKTHGSQIVKNAYDRLGRVTDRFTSAVTDDDTTYANASSLATDVVLEQAHMALDPKTGRTLAQWLVQRAHDDLVSTDAIDSNGDGLPLMLTLTDLVGGARPQITGTWYDAWDRVATVASFGIDDATSDFDRGSMSAPTTTTADHLVTLYTYENFGRLETITDPAGKVSKTKYDFAGRKEKTIDNFVDGTPGGGSDDQDRVMEYTYSAGLLASTTRKMPSSLDDQVTGYTYGTTLSGSQIATGHLLGTITLPDSNTASYTYNAVSQAVTSTDPAGNVITSSFDTLGRTTARIVTTYSGGAYSFDTRVKEIDTSYNSRGMVSDILQKNAGGTTLDEIALTYDGWGNLVQSEQDPDSAIGASGRASYKLTWTYALNTTTDAWRNLYMSQWQLPDGSSGATYLPQFYSFIDTAVARTSYVYDPSYNPIVWYDYMGTATVVNDLRYESSVGSSLFATSSADYPTYMDRFNRPIKFCWNAHTSTTPFAVTDWTLVYDDMGNVTTLQDDVLKDGSGTRTFDQVSTFDDLHRLVNRKDGEQTSGAITTTSREEVLSRNLAGRISSYQADMDGDGVYDTGTLTQMQAGDMDDNRLYSKRNQLTGRSYWDTVNDHLGSRVTRTLAYDACGNLRDDAEKYKYVYNPWGQLVKITDQSSNAVAEYTYNGLGQRISEHTDTNHPTKPGETDGVVDGTDSIFFIAVDPQGRRVATFRGTGTYPKERYVYHCAGTGVSGGATGPAMRGGIILRERGGTLAATPTDWDGAAATSTLSERNHYLSDVSGNVFMLFTADLTGGELLEQVRYSPLGIPFGVPQGSVKGDGVVSTTTGPGTDHAIVTAMIGVTYEARADFNFDGVVDGADLAFVVAAAGNAAGRGKLTTPNSANRFGTGGREYFGEAIYTLASRSLLGLNISTAESESEVIVYAPYPVSSCPSVSAIARTCQQASVITRGDNSAVLETLSAVTTNRKVLQPEAPCTECMLNTYQTCRSPSCLGEPASCLGSPADPDDRRVPIAPGNDLERVLLRFGCEFCCQQIADNRRACCRAVKAWREAEGVSRPGDSLACEAYAGNGLTMCIGTCITTYPLRNIWREGLPGQRPILPGPGDPNPNPPPE